jgi:hypothetical protein
MPTPEAITQRLAQIERELTRALDEYPGDRAVYRMKYARALARAVKRQIELDDEATIPVLDHQLPAARSEHGQR